MITVMTGVLRPKIIYINKNVLIMTNNNNVFLWVIILIRILSMIFKLIMKYKNNKSILLIIIIIKLTKILFKQILIAIRIIILSLIIITWKVKVMEIWI